MKNTLLVLASALLLGACATGPQGLHIDTSHTSQNQDSRALFLVLHYTVLDYEKSLRVLTTGGQVSSHYLVRDEPPTIYRLVDENRRAWHAGPSFWAGHSNLNSSSIGIEIVNPGYKDTPEGRVYAPFSQPQIDAVIKLSQDIVARHGIKPERVIGHADIAPGRKQDPGPMFPWKQLHQAGLIAWPDAAQVAAKISGYAALLPDTAWAQDKLARIGYNVPRHGELDELTKQTLVTFQMKYRPALYDGVLDAETAALLDTATTPGGMRMATTPLEGPTKPYTSRW
ncbi:N-acetylmuramoyl-L-alanine amidase [Paucibacter sp. M5-1]|uniref:N-acetylmuramoyl-L-alanine amidase n=1 Tax=Paucibacter sp. M5-1 TaxID=3015998 RepID=UPI0022B89692|nr:N-acetylmuramoyl-L-alanine amidase [Paucibacter sp. M5-1]MCZ7882350.1 N-acetylmuramoyl-L-alanine amidase [Paucibacter sp. M5-1]